MLLLIMKLLESLLYKGFLRKQQKKTPHSCDFGQTELNSVLLFSHS